MIKINLNNKVGNKVQWLPKNQYSPYAIALISKYANDNGELDEDGINNIRTVMDSHINGETTAKGYSVSVRYLLGAINQISPELADALTSNVDSSKSTTESEFF